MSQEEIDALERAFRKMEFSQNQINFAIAVIRNHVEPLRQQLAAKQAEVDALMLEYCPSEMSQEQLDNWAAHQRPSEWKTNDELRKQPAELLDWQQKAFAAHPNIDIDIDRMEGN